MDWTATSSGHWNDTSSVESFHIFLFLAIFYSFGFQLGSICWNCLGKKKAKIKDGKNQ